MPSPRPKPLGIPHTGMTEQRDRRFSSSRPGLSFGRVRKRDLVTLPDLLESPVVCASVLHPIFAETIQGNWARGQQRHELTNQNPFDGPGGPSPGESYGCSVSVGRDLIR